MLRLLIAFLIGLFLFAPKLGTDVQRGVLWRVVQACIADHSLTGAAFPCLAVQTQAGLEDGFVVLRAPFVRSHTIISPTAQTVGIEAPRLRGPTAPNYFEDAWSSRGYATEGLGRLPGRADFALAVNSRVGRSQDQLHIHIDCIRPQIKDALARANTRSPVGRWSRAKVMSMAPHYWLTAIQGDTLQGVNVFDLVADGLNVQPDAMDDITIVVVGADDIAGKPGFFVLARKRLENTRDEAHGEALMDHSCPAFR